MEGTFEVTLSQRDKYQFDVDFQDGSGTTLRMDEPEPLGDGLGPSAARVAAAVVAVVAAPAERLGFRVATRAAAAAATET